MRTDVLGVGFDDISVTEACVYAYEAFDAEKKACIVTPNPEIVWACRQNEELRGALNSAGLVLPDGIGIIIAARILGTPVKAGRVPGIDFIAALFSKMAEAGKSVFLYGAKPGVADEAGARLTEKYPGLIIAGTSDGYTADDALVIEQINAARPDLLLVCLGSPKQELWMAQNISRLDVRLCAGLGG